MLLAVPEEGWRCEAQQIGTWPIWRFFDFQGSRRLPPGDNSPIVGRQAGRASAIPGNKCYLLGNDVRSGREHGWRILNGQ